jgi:hypothetical protein
MSLEQFDKQVYELYELLHKGQAADLPGLGKSAAYQELFQAAQDTEPEDFGEFLGLFEYLAFYLAGGEDDKARFLGKSMEELPDFILQDMESVNGSNR